MNERQELQELLEKFSEYQKSVDNLVMSANQEDFADALLEVESKKTVPLAYLKKIKKNRIEKRG